MDGALLGRAEEWEAGPAEGLAFVRRRAAGQLGGGGVGQDVGVRGFSCIIASALSVTSLSPREWVDMGLRREVKV